MFIKMFGMVVAAVLTWAPVAKEVLPEMDTVSVLAMIHIESTGDVNARRPNSRYHGLLQISQPYLTDALDYAGHDMVQASTLMGDGAFSIQVMAWYMRRYSYIHGWHPRYIALVHKAGPNVSQEILQEVREGSSLIDAAHNSRIPDAGDYIKRFDQHVELYTEVIQGGEG